MSMSSSYVSVLSVLNRKILHENHAESTFIQLLSKEVCMECQALVPQEPFIRTPEPSQFFSAQCPQIIVPKHF